HCHNKVCKEFIQALHSCHAGGWARFTGECNEARSELNRCLQSDVSISATYILIALP
ncbi:hypothetical protein FIBSPDRAFT_725808, partial [Athelia psychrophila]